MDYGKHIRDARELSGMNQYALAAKLGVPQSVLSDWERGKREPDERQTAKALSIIKRHDEKCGAKLAAMVEEAQS
jgi:ribosome-binding protein aMBF1 (putative translation factor)